MKLKKGDPLWYIDGAGQAQEIVFIRRRGREIEAERPFGPPSHGRHFFIIPRTEVYLCREDAENFARIVRGWLADPSTLE